MRISLIILLLVSVAIMTLDEQRTLSNVSPSGQSAPFPVVIRIDASQTKGELHPVWRFFGADEPNFAYMKDGKKLIAELGQLQPRAVYFRTHNLLTSGDGTPALKWGSSNAYYNSRCRGRVCRCSSSNGRAQNFGIQVREKR